MRILTPKGLSLDIEHTTDWKTGATTYRIAHIGTFILNWSDTDTDDETHLGITYGNGSNFDFSADKPEAPVIYGVRLTGWCGFHTTSMREEPSHWLHASRATEKRGYTEVPDGTRERVADILRTLVAHWQANPEHTDLRRAFLHAQAPGRLARRRREIKNLTAELAALQQRLDAAREAEAAEHTRVQAGPITPPEAAVPRLILQPHHLALDADQPPLPLAG